MVAESSCRQNTAGNKLCQPKKPLKNQWFDVRRKLKRFPALIFALSILMSFDLAYCQYDRLGEIRFLCPNLAPVSFEAADQEDLAIASPADPNGIPSASFVNPGYSGIHPFKGSSRFSFHPFPFEKKLPLLRCCNTFLPDLSATFAKIS